MQSLRQVFATLWRNPGELLVRRWNWKSALYSSLLRSSLFFVVNLGAGLDAAVGAMAVEFAYRSVSAGFYGALTQAFRQVRPVWQAMLAATSTLIFVSHTVEFLLHWLRGTPNLITSIAVSCAFTVVSTLFNLHAMRRGVLLTDGAGHDLLTDLRSLPSLFRRA